MAKKNCTLEERGGAFCPEEQCECWLRWRGRRIDGNNNKKQRPSKRRKWGMGLYVCVCVQDISKVCACKESSVGRAAFFFWLCVCVCVVLERDYTERL